MSGRGENPDEDDEQLEIDLSPGTVLYTEEGNPVGTIRGVEEGGVFVSTREGAESLSIEHARTGHTFGQGELMWRCTVCGEMGEIDEGLPETCPSCGTEKENLMYWTED